MVTSQATGRYVDAVVRGRADRDAYVIGSLPGGRYTLHDPVSGGDFEADSMLTTVIGIGKRVLVRLGVSGNSRGGKPVIIGASQAADNGVIAGELAVTAPVAAETIMKLPELPVILVAGGLNVVVTIFGFGLSSAVVYGAAGITNDVAQVTDDLAITIRPKASGATPKGSYSATVAGVVIPYFFEVV